VYAFEKKQDFYSAALYTLVQTSMDVCVELASSTLFTALLWLILTQIDVGLHDKLDLSFMIAWGCSMRLATTLTLQTIVNLTQKEALLHHRSRLWRPALCLRHFKRNRCHVCPVSSPALHKFPVPCCPRRSEAAGASGRDARVRRSDERRAKNNTHGSQPRSSLFASIIELRASRTLYENGFGLRSVSFDFNTSRFEHLVL